MTTREEAARTLLEAAKYVTAHGCVTNYEGNLSVRFGERMLITPSQTAKDSLTEELLVEANAYTGEIYYASEGKRASTEIKLHTCCYRSRPDVTSVVHGHTPAATAFAVCGLPIETRAYPEMIVLFGKVPICRYGRPSTDAVCDEVPSALEKYDIFLLANHGPVAVGDSVMKAVQRLECCERVADMLLKTKLLGGEKALPDEEVDALHALRQR